MQNEGQRTIPGERVPFDELPRTDRSRRRCHGEDRWQTGEKGQNPLCPGTTKARHQNLQRGAQQK